MKLVLGIIPVCLFLVLDTVYAGLGNSKATQRKKIYLAGPDVFRPNAVEYGRFLVSLCKDYGYEGLYPLDNQAPADLKGKDLADWIYEANVALIEKADIVMANLNFFRGAEPDSGTSWEVGYAKALGKPVYGYIDTDGGLPIRIRRETNMSIFKKGDLLVDKDGMIVEDFGYPVNLMLAASTKVVVGDASECLDQIKADDEARLIERVTSTWK